MRLIVCLFVIQTLAAQNIIIDGGFELLKGPFESQCRSFNSTDTLKLWRDISSEENPWFEVVASEGPCGTKPNSGKNCLGYLAYAENRFSNDGKTVLKTYGSPAIYTRFKNKLIRGKTYKITMFVKRENIAWLAVDKFTIAFSDSYEKPFKDLVPVTLQKTFPSTMIRDTTWTKVLAIYVAQGDEEYMYLASFMDQIKWEKDPSAVGKINGNAFYFIDDIAIEEELCTPIIDLGLPKTLKKNVPITLKNIFFENGKSSLLPGSYKELDKLIKLLKENPTAQIEIRGHTDNVGQDADNQKLSQERAKAVYDYLISKGIAGTRLSYKGFGASKPIADNSKEHGRISNRRVEFIVLKI